MYLRKRGRTPGREGEEKPPGSMKTDGKNDGRIFREGAVRGRRRAAGDSAPRAGSKWAVNTCEDRSRSGSGPASEYPGQSF